MRTQKKRSYRRLLFALGLLLILFIAGCALPSQTVSSSGPSTTTGCNNKECFISAANNCNEVSLTFTEDIGIFNYSSSKDCVFTKTLVSLNDNEAPEMKKLLSGKNLICIYKNGNFDQRLITSLIFGTENCKGELKDILGRLILFAEQGS